MNLPLVTLLTSIYNHEKYLDDYFDSIVNQTYENIQLILIDDCSTDNSTKVVEKWKERLEARFNRFVYIPRSRNMGLIYNCNHGLSLATGKYICLIDSDDAMLPQNIEEKVKFLESNHDFGMVYSDGYIIKDSDRLKNNGRRKFKRFSHNRKLYEDKILIQLIEKGNFILSSSVLARKEILLELGGFSHEYMFEDYYMWLQIAKKYKVKFIMEPLIYYRFSSNSLSRKPESFSKLIRDHEKLLLRFNEEKYKQHVMNGIENLYKGACKYYFKNNMKGDFNTFYLKINNHSWRLKVMKFILEMGISPSILLKLKNL